MGRVGNRQDGDLFNKLDVNKDGFVTSDEVPDAQKSLFERLLRNADKDGDKKLNKDEFQAGLKPDEAPKPPLAGGQGPGGPRGGKGDPASSLAAWMQIRTASSARMNCPSECGRILPASTPTAMGRSVPKSWAAPAARRPPRERGLCPDKAPAAKSSRLCSTAPIRTATASSPRKRFPKSGQECEPSSSTPGGTSIDKEQFVRGMLAMAAQFGQPPRPEAIRRDRTAPCHGRMGRLVACRRGCDYSVPLTRIATVSFPQRKSLPPAHRF